MINLEKKNKKNWKESDTQSLVSAWMKVPGNAWDSFPYEVKISNGGTILFSAFQPQQLPALYNARHGVKHHKMTDASIGSKPFDAFVFVKSEAYVCLHFHAQKQKRIVYFLGIDDVYELKTIPGKKSIAEDDCIKRCARVVELQ